MSTAIPSGSTQPASDSQFMEPSAPQESSDTQSSESTEASSEEISSESDVDAALEDGIIDKQEAKALKRKFQLKIDGKDEDLELDLNNDDEVKKHLQKSKSFDKRSKEWAGFKTQVDQFISQLKSSPDSVLEQLGINVDDFAEKRIQRRLEEMSKSPEQLEREKMQQELESLRKEKEDNGKAREKAEQELLLKKTVSEIESGIMKALESTGSKLPKNNPEVLGEIAKAMKEAMKHGYNEVTVEDVIPMVEKRYMQRVKALFDILPEDMIESYMGQNNAERLRKKRLTKMVPPTARQAATDTGESSRASSMKERAEAAAKDKKMTFSEFFKK